MYPKVNEYIHGYYCRKYALKTSIVKKSSQGKITELDLPICTDKGQRNQHLKLTLNTLPMGFHSYDLAASLSAGVILGHLF